MADEFEIMLVGSATAARDQLAAALAEAGTVPHLTDDLDGVAPGSFAGGVAFLLTAATTEDHQAALVGALEADAADVVAIVTDDYLGSDGEDLLSPRISAGAVAAVRAKATRRGAARRANAVCIPVKLVGPEPAQRGPLAHETDWHDVASAVTFLLDPSNAYLHGQVLFVDGGRHLFSSMSA